MQCKWAYERLISDDDLHILYNALLPVEDSYIYYPLAVAKRSEVGLNYRFLCLAVPGKNQECASHLAVIGVYKPPYGVPYATCLYKKDFDQLFPD